MQNIYIYIGWKKKKIMIESKIKFIGVEKILKKLSRNFER